MSHRKQLIKVIAAQSAASSANAVETEVVLMNKKKKLPRNLSQQASFLLQITIMCDHEE